MTMAKHKHTNMDDLNAIMEKIFASHGYIGAPNNSATYQHIASQVMTQMQDIIENSTLFGKQAEATFIDFDLKFKKEVNPLTLSEVVEERLESFIYETMDRQYIQECGSCIHSVVMERAYEEIDKVLHEEEVEEEEFEKVSSEVMDNIDFESLYEIIDNILDAPITMEEKLAEIGMSQRDFL